MAVRTRFQQEVAINIPHVEPEVGCAVMAGFQQVHHAIAFVAEEEVF